MGGLFFRWGGSFLSVYVGGCPMVASVLMGGIKKYKLNEEIEFRLVYFNSVTKAVTNHVFGLEKSFEEILYINDVWINNGSGWVIESIESQYINISTCRPLSGSCSIDLPVELRSPKKGLIDIKNKDKKCFLWCHVRHIDILNKHPEKKIEKWQKNCWRT